MKKTLLAAVVLSIITINAYAEVVNLQTSGVTKVVNNQSTRHYEGAYSFSLDLNRNTIFINQHDLNNQANFYQTGTFHIKQTETIQDSHLGKAYVFLASKNNIDYTFTITKSMISFSNSRETTSLCWHFHIK